MHRCDAPTKHKDIDPEHRIYARSAGDDKAPVITILTALDMIQANKIDITSNLVFFFEGQEEARDWMFDVQGYFPSFFGFWKKCMKQMKEELWTT